jgi:hypothetical protein
MEEQNRAKRQKLAWMTNPEKVEKERLLEIQGTDRPIAGEFRYRYFH